MKFKCLMLQPIMKSPLEMAMATLAFPSPTSPGACTLQVRTKIPSSACEILLGEVGFYYCWICGFDFPKLWYGPTSAAVTMTGLKQP